VAFSYFFNCTFPCARPDFVFGFKSTVKRGQAMHYAFLPMRILDTVDWLMPRNRATALWLYPSFPLTQYSFLFIVVLREYYTPAFRQCWNNRCLNCARIWAQDIEPLQNPTGANSRSPLHHLPSVISHQPSAFILSEGPTSYFPFPISHLSSFP